MSAGVRAPTLLVVQHEASTGPGWFGRWLGEAGVGLNIVHPYVDAGALELPALDGVDLDGIDGLLVLGGAMGPAQDGRFPWLPATRSLLAQAVERELPAFGICLGGELLALACGGTVRRGVEGPELGVLPFALTAAAVADPVFGGLPERVEVLQWHWEEIASLPPGAVLLGSSAAYPHQVFRVGTSAWGVQGHPEVTAAIAAGWAREDSPLLLAAGREPADLVAEMARHEARLALVWAPVAARFADLVRARARARRQHSGS